MYHIYTGLRYSWVCSSHAYYHLKLILLVISASKSGKEETGCVGGKSGTQHDGSYRRLSTAEIAEYTGDSAGTLWIYDGHLVPKSLAFGHIFKAVR